MLFSKPLSSFVPQKTVHIKCLYKYGTGTRHKSSAESEMVFTSGFAVGPGLTFHFQSFLAGQSFIMICGWLTVEFFIENFSLGNFAAGSVISKPEQGGNYTVWGMIDFSGC